MTTSSSQPITTPEIQTLNYTQPIRNAEPPNKPTTELQRVSIKTNFQQQLHKIADLASNLGPGFNTQLIFKNIDITK